MFARIRDTTIPLAMGQAEMFSEGSVIGQILKHDKHKH